MAVMDSMLDGIFYQRLKDHAWNADVFDVFIYFPDIYNISGKAHIQDVDIIIYRLDLLPEHRIFFHLAHIIPEKIRHFFPEIYLSCPHLPSSPAVHLHSGN